MVKHIFAVEPEAFEGVKRIAGKVASDFEKVCGELPDIVDYVPDAVSYDNIFIFATLGKSSVTDKLIQEGKFDPSAVKGKREIYQIKRLDHKTLFICGSDKRGTIYGMFALSEFIGVSPLHFWGDVDPVRCENIEITGKVETISKEPSVRYRGFFINDEWPCFGSWTFGRFGGFTADMYDHVFELLLRLKGNYLWPAMWSSSFPLDGPGNLNEELADIYGVVIGASHHEPCLRASEEWDKVKGPETEYGTAWNYYTNKEGLIKFWEDGLKRSGKYEKIITIGMRGERDTSMLGHDSPLKDNIELLKDIIKKQRELIQKHVNPDIDAVPQLLAIYKEVEEYFYGNEQTEGLKDWDGLNGIICMFCEDNFGFMRRLPSEEIRGRKGGFGMYYHLDYHGCPRSYEWMPSTSFERIWEQMSMAYDYGIRDVWIVNVGDLKFNEVPLSFFMELAFDFEKWGARDDCVEQNLQQTNSFNRIDSYTEMWLAKTFPAVDLTVREKMASVLHGYIRVNAMRRPEALNVDVYHPCHYLETDRMLALAEKLDTVNEDVCAELSKNMISEKTAYYSMIYIPAKASINLLRMHLYAGKNRHYANQGKKIANHYAALVTACIEKDHALSKEIAAFRNGKWKGMELGQHIGFTKWNDSNCRYPLRYQVEPVNKPRMVVSRKDADKICVQAYSGAETIIVDDFLYAGNDTVIIEIANDGIGSLNYIVEPQADYDWLEISSLKGSVESQEELILRCNKQKLASKPSVGEIQNARLLIKDGETVIAIEVNVKARAVVTEDLPPMTFLENNGVITIEANHFCGKKDVPSGCFTELKNYGRSGCGMKVFPTTVVFNEKDDKPSLTYRFLVEEAGDHIVEVWTTPTNSVKTNQPLRLLLTDLRGVNQVVTTVPVDFRAGDHFDMRWNVGVLNNIRISNTSFTFNKGVQEISVGALEAGVILERILIYRKGKEPLQSYLGPPESFYVK